MPVTPARPRGSGPRRGSADAAAGVSLIEVLVALVVLTIGLLSMIALQLVAKRSNVEAAQREAAAAIAHDMIERMRANNAASALGEYLALAARGIGGGRHGSAPERACDAAACDAAGLAAYDVWLLEQLLDGSTERVAEDGQSRQAGGLAAPQACIDGPGSGGTGSYRVTLAWRGTMSLPSIAGPPCGLGSAAYGPDDRYRRTVSVPAFIASR